MDARDDKSLFSAELQRRPAVRESGGDATESRAHGRLYPFTQTGRTSLGPLSGPFPSSPLNELLLIATVAPWDAVSATQPTEAGAICSTWRPCRKPHAAGSGGIRPRGQLSVRFRLNTPLCAEGNTQESEAHGPTAGPPASASLTRPASQGDGPAGGGAAGITTATATAAARRPLDVLPPSSGPVYAQSASPGARGGAGWRAFIRTWPEGSAGLRGQLSNWICRARCLGVTKEQAAAASLIRLLSRRVARRRVKNAPSSL